MLAPEQTIAAAAAIGLCVGCALSGEYRLEETGEVGGAGALGGNGGNIGFGGTGGSVPVGGTGAAGASGTSAGCNPVDPTAPTAEFVQCAGTHCFPAQSPGPATCGGTVGSGKQGDTCGGTSECASGLLCVSDQCHHLCHVSSNCPPGTGCDLSLPYGYAADQPVGGCYPCGYLPNCVACCQDSNASGREQLVAAVDACVCLGTCASACSTWCATKKADSPCSACYASSAVQACMAQKCSAQACKDYRSCETSCP